MAPTAVLKTSGEFGLNTVVGGVVTSTTLGAITFAANSLVVVVLGEIKSDLTATTLSCSASGLTFTDRAHASQNLTSKGDQAIFTAPDASGGSRAITITSGTRKSAGLFYAIYEVTGHDTTTPIGATATQADNLTNGAKTMTLSAAPATSSLVIAAVVADSDPGLNQIDPGSTFTESVEIDSAGGTNYGVMQVQMRTGSTSTTVDWADVSAGASTATYSTAGAAIEIKAPAVIPFVAGDVSEDGVCNDFGWPGNAVTELLYSITLKAADLANGDTLRFRVVDSNPEPVLTYTQYPTLNVTVSGGTTFNVPVSDPEGLTDSTSMVLSMTYPKTDNLGLTDSASVVLTGVGQIIDPLGLTDSTNMVLGMTYPKTDNLGLTDVAAAGMTQPYVKVDALGLTDSATQTLAANRYINTVHSSGRYFLDQLGNPILIKGDSPWAILQNCSVAQMEHYLDVRASQGFNFVLISLLGNVANGAPNNNGQTYDAVLPFVGGDPSVLNATYWDRVENFFSKAAELNITVMAYPIDGWVGTSTYSGLAAAWSNATAQAYGQAIGARIASHPNVIYAVGGDYPNTGAGGATDQRFYNVLVGLAAAGADRLASIQFERGETSWDNSYWDLKVDFNFVYPHSLVYILIEQAYTDANGNGDRIPALMGESYYENRTGIAGFTDDSLRAITAWALTSGSPGDVYGSEDIWNVVPTDPNMNTTAVAQVASVRATFQSLVGWHKLVPDYSSTFITAGRGTKGLETGTMSSAVYVTGGVTLDGKLGVIYHPTATSTTITIDQSKMGLDYTARWVDPTNGASVAATPGATYTKTGSNAAGGADWLLILESVTGISLNVSPTDNEGLTDSSIRVMALAWPAIDPLGLTDSIVATQGHVLNQSDNLGLTDSAQIVMAKVHNQTDNLGLTDSAVATQTHARTVVDNEGLTDSIVSVGSWNANVSDTLGLTDNATVLMSSAGVINAIDNEGLTDSIVAVGSWNANVSDTLGLTDNATVFMSGAGVVNVTDNEDLTDSASIVETHVRLVSDAINLTDFAQEALALARSQADALGLTDSAVIVIGRTLVTVDSMNLTDSTLMTKTNPIIKVDALGLTDDAAVQLSGIVTGFTGWGIPI